MLALRWDRAWVSPWVSAGQSLLGVERLDDPGQRQPAGQLAGATGRQRLLLGRGDEVVDLLRALLDAPVQRTVVLRLAVLHVGPQRGLEALGLAQGGLLVALRRVDRAVEDHPPDVGREEVGVLRPDVGAVRRAEVGQPGLAERLAQHVHVAHHLLGRHVRDQVAGALLARLTELLDRLGELGALGGGVRVGVLGQVGVHPRGVEALEPGAVVDPARVEADQVVAAGDRLGEGSRPRLGVLDPGAAGTAGVDHQRADRLAGGGHLVDRDPDRLALRVVVVERHGQVGALVAVAAGLPVELLVVVRRQGGRGARHAGLRQRLRPRRNRRRRRHAGPRRRTPRPRSARTPAPRSRSPCRHPSPDRAASRCRAATGRSAGSGPAARARAAAGASSTWAQSRWALPPPRPGSP